MSKTKTVLQQEPVVTIDQLREILVGGDFITKKQYSEAVDTAIKFEREIEDVMVEKGMITHEQLGTLIAGFKDYRFVKLSEEGIIPEFMDKVPEVVARNSWLMAYGRGKRGVKVAMNDPDDLQMRHMLDKRLGEEIEVYYATKNDLANAFFQYKQNLGQAFSTILEQLRNEELSLEERDNLTIDIVDKMLQYGFFNKASDIHLEPQENRVLVRFRIDGILHDVAQVPKNIYPLLLTRIKILARMRTDEHLAAQDGKLQFSPLASDNGNDRVDVRVSVVPIVDGEKVVMRILSAVGRQFTLVDLGMNDENLVKVNRAISYPHGMILVTGPTGSGKTTTLYAMLKVLNKREVNIATIEDPVEYDMEGVNQIQVNPRTNLTFPKGLRAIVRQDPDIIMVGEIRDEETADIGVNAALTGHLVLSTLHTNDAATTLPRLLDMEVEPFLVASTVNIAIAQRLVRKICLRCRVSFVPKKDSDTYRKLLAAFKQKYEKDFEKKMKGVRIYEGKGCEVCNHTGYTGRIGIFEVMEMTETIRQLVINRASSDEIKNLAEKEGMATMFEDGLEKVMNGVTTIEEVYRVTLQ